MPARRAKISLVDRIYARKKGWGIGQHHARTVDVPMVEMQETANILHGASSEASSSWTRSDARTATFDGLSIAWAVAEHSRHE